MEAAEMVAKAAERFVAALQHDNPVRGEAAFANSLARMFQLMPFQVRGARAQLLPAHLELISHLAFRPSV